MSNFSNNQQMFSSNVSPQIRNQFVNPYLSPTSGAGASTNNIIWVQGIEGAKAWQLNPNSIVILLDSEVEGKMYIKVSDNIGMCSLRIFNYVEEIPSTNSATVNNDLDLSQFVKKDELLALIKEVIDNEQSISAITGETVSDGTATSAKPNTMSSPTVM